MDLVDTKTLISTQNFACFSSSPSHSEMHLHPTPQCSFNISSSTPIPRFPLCTYSSSQSLRKINSITSRAIPSRDRIIDFGKYKGKMLGTLPSKYLKWVTKNLRARDFEEWTQLADQVLSDPIYKDRIEWEFAQNLLNGDVSPATQNAVSELLEISTRFGWDNEDKLGWSKIDFEMLGTSKGGRIPRLSDAPNKSRNSIAVGNIKKGSVEVDSSEECEKDSRERRRERARLQRRNNDLQHSTVTENTSSGNKDHFVSETASRFPGREALLNKASSLGSRKSF